MADSYSDFHRRQIRAEKRWERVFFRYLKSEYLRAGKNYPQPYIADTESLEKIFRRLYLNLTIEEAKIAYKDVLEPLEGNRLREKDIIDSLLSVTTNGNGLINIWRNLLGEFLQVRVAQRITSITDTTRKNITKLIENSINEGLGAEETARVIRREAGEKLNIHRSRAIARTETISSMNQGKFMAAQSSNLVMEKSWRAANDARTRDSHRDMHRFGEWIPLDQDFQLANKRGMLEPALYPGANTLSPENVCNCRCSLVFRPLRDESGRLIRKT